MLASAWWCTAQIKGKHCGYWICCQRNEARLALDQAQHLTCHNWICNLFFSFKKGWLKIFNLQQLNGQIRNMANRPRSDPGLTRVWPGPSSNLWRRSAKLPLSSPSCAINGNWLPWDTAHWSTGIAVWRDAPQTAVPRHGRVSQRGRRRHQELSCYTGGCMMIHCSYQRQT